MHEMHSSVLVNAYEIDLIQARRTGTSPNARWESKACSPQPLRSSRVRAEPSLRMIWECSTRIAASLDGMDPVPSTSATDRGDHGRPGLHDALPICL